MIERGCTSRSGWGVASVKQYIQAVRLQASAITVKWLIFLKLLLKLYDWFDSAHGPNSQAVSLLGGLYLAKWPSLTCPLSSSKAVKCIHYWLESLPVALIRYFIKLRTASALSTARGIWTNAASCAVLSKNVSLGTDVAMREVAGLRVSTSIRYKRPCLY